MISGMLDEIIKERILDFHEEGIPEYVPRDMDLVHFKDMATTIVGGRKTGKTYLTYQFIDRMIQEGTIESVRDVCYLHFDDESLMALKTSDLSKIDRIFLSLGPLKKPAGRNILFVFDEIHKIEGWQEFVLRLRKKRNQFVIVTGSSADIEEDKVAKQLRGKTFTYRLYPLSFREFTRFLGIEPKGAAFSGSMAARMADAFPGHPGLLHAGNGGGGKEGDQGLFPAWKKISKD
jgi:hypothetical protein